MPDTRDWPPLRLREVPPAPAFPIDVFPAPLQTYAAELAAATQAPLDLAGGVMLAGASAAIGQSLNLALKRSWCEAPLLYLILVVPPGGKKTAMLRLGLEPLNAIDARLRRESHAARKKWITQMRSHRLNQLFTAPPPEPPRRRAVVRDITRESLCTLMHDNPRGLLCAPDEGSAWVASCRPSQGKGTDRPFWMANHSGAAITVDRKGDRESIHLEYPFVTVVAGIPPDMLWAFREERGREEGLLDRILLVMPDRAAWPPHRWDDRGVNQASAKSWTDAIERLHARPMAEESETSSNRPGLVSFSDAGARAWRDWYDALGAEIDAPECSEQRAAMLSKFLGTSARLALIISRLRLAVEPISNLRAPVT